MNKETERLLSKVRKELYALGLEVERKRNAKLLRRYQELQAMLD